MLSKDLRPLKLSEMIGHKKIIEEMKERSKKMDFPDVMMLEGNTGSGKTTLAMIIARLLNCHSPIAKRDGTFEPCGECPACKDVMNEKYNRDIYFIDASSMGKEDVLQLSEKASHAPMFDKNKVIIIDEAQNLSNAGKGATLKLLEKKYKNVYFILCTMDINAFDKAIKARATGYKFWKVPPKEIAEYLFNYMDELEGSEEIPEEFFSEGIFTIADAADGSVRNALQLLERVIYGKIYKKEDIIKELAVIDDNTINTILLKAMNGDKEVFSAINSIDTNEFFYKSRKILTDSLIYKYSGEVKEEWKEKSAKLISSQPNFDKIVEVFNSVDENPYFKPSSLFAELGKYFKTNFDTPHGVVRKKVE